VRLRHFLPPALGLLLVAGALAAQEPPKARQRTPRAVERVRKQAADTKAPAPAAQTAPAALPTPEPPGAQGPLPQTMDKIAQATDVPFKPKPGGALVKFNLQDADLAELVNHISGLTGRRFIYGAKVRQIKATVVSPEPVTLDEAYQAFLSILEANGMTVVPHGRFLKIVDSGGVVSQPTPLYDRGEPVPDADRYITRLYRLQNVSPDEIVPVLTKFKSKEGDITAYAPGRLLIITDTATQVRRLIRIIEEVDVGGSGQRMWIEPVRHGSAQDMAKRINELFDVGGGGGKGDGAGIRGSGLTRVVADDQANALIVVGTEDSYIKMLELLKRLDSAGTDVGRVHVLPLQHAIADELASTLTQMLAGQPQAKGQSSGGGNAGGMFEGEVRVTADKSTNSLIITSSNRDYATLRLVVDKLDRPRRQVFIEAVIMDLSVSDTTSLGVAFHGGTTLGNADDTLVMGGFRAGSSLAFPADPNLLQGFAAGVRGPDLPNTNNLLGTGLSIPAFGVVLNALATSGKSNVLATPHIIATDNVAAEINIGENIPLQTNVGGGLSSLGNLAGAAGGANALGLLGSLSGGFSAPRQDVGNKIKVTPHINESDQVRLEIEQESSAPGAAVGQLGAVTITKRTANTTVVVADQQTVVIGGLMRDEYTTSREKIPVLGDIPVLGALFRRSETTKRKANLLLILTPHVIREQADLRKIFERKMQERQEFIDRYFVFSDSEWSPPKDWSRTNGLVEDVRQQMFELAEQERLELESQRTDYGERLPSEPIELPGSVKAGSGASLGGGAQPGQAAPAADGRRQRRAAPAAPAAPAQPAPPAPQGPRGDLDSPIRINPIARNVNVERVE
jgi:general secretion pathway protein D